MEKELINNEVTSSKYTVASGTLVYGDGFLAELRTDQ